MEVIHQQDVRLDHIEHQQKQEQQLFKFGDHIDQQNVVSHDEDKVGARLCKQQPHVGGFFSLTEKFDKFLLGKALEGFQGADIKQRLEQKGEIGHGDVRDQIRRPVRHGENGQ